MSRHDEIKVFLLLHWILNRIFFYSIILMIILYKITGYSKRWIDKKTRYYSDLIKTDSESTAFVRPHDFRFIGMTIFAVGEIIGAGGKCFWAIWTAIEHLAGVPGHVLSEFQFSAELFLANVAFVFAHFEMDVTSVSGEGALRGALFAAHHADMFAYVAMPSLVTAQCFSVFVPGKSIGCTTFGVYNQFERLITIACTVYTAHVVLARYCDASDVSVGWRWWQTVWHRHHRQSPWFWHASICVWPLRISRRICGTIETTSVLWNRDYEQGIQNRLRFATFIANELFLRVCQMAGFVICELRFQHEFLRTFIALEFSFLIG